MLEVESAYVKKTKHSIKSLGFSALATLIKLYNKLLVSAWWYGLSILDLQFFCTFAKVGLPMYAVVRLCNRLSSPYIDHLSFT